MGRFRLCIAPVLYAFLSLFCSPALWAEEAGTLKVAILKNYPPYEFINEKGEADGYHTALLEATARRCGFRIDYQLMSWPEIIDALSENRIDLYASMGYSEERAEIFRFSNPHSRHSYSIFTKGQDETVSIDDLKIKRTAVVEDSTVHRHLMNNCSDYALITVSDSAEGLRYVSAGKADAVILPALSGTYLVKELGYSDISAGGFGILPYNVAFAAPIEKAELLQCLNTGISELKMDGTFDKIYSEWFNIIPPKDQNRPALLLFIASAVSAVFLLTGILIWRYSLKTAIDRATEHLRAEENKLGELTMNLAANTEELESIRRQKRTALSEVHHRVKNNLQMLISLTELQQTFSGSPANEESLGKIRNSIYSMSFAFEYFYDSGNLLTVDLREYLEILINRILLDSGRSAAAAVTLIEIESNTVEAYKAIVIAFIISEFLMENRGRSGLRAGWFSGKSSSG